MKIAIFIEGESEMMFSSYLIKVIYGLDAIKIKYISFKSDDAYQENVKPEEGYGAQIKFILFNCGNDKRVVNKLKENGESMLQKGYDAVIGLRDVKSQEYDKLTGKKIDSAIVKAMISNTRAVLEGFEGVELFYAVMELEAWYLGLTNCLVKAGYNLQTISATIGVNLEEIDPEKEFYNAKSTIQSFETAFTEIKFAHKIGSNLEETDIEEIEKANKLEHFIEYTNALKSYKKLLKMS